MIRRLIHPNYHRWGTAQRDLQIVAHSRPFKQNEVIYEQLIFSTSLRTIETSRQASANLL